MIKNIKKRSVSETEVTEKKGEAVGKNKVIKKTKTEKTVQNGQTNKQVKKDTPKNSKVDTKKNKNLNVTSKKDENLKGRRRFKEKDGYSVDELKTKIEEITSRDEISKTARRKLAFLKKLLRVKQGQSGENTQQPQKAKNAKLLEAVKNKQNKKLGGHVETKSKNQNKGKNTKQQKKEKDEDEEEEEDSELSQDENESDVEEEEEEDEEDESEEEDEAEEQESEDDDDDDDEDDEDNEDEGEDNENENEKVKTNNVQLKKGKETNTNEEAKKKRYVVFVGNLPYTITSEELKKHFLTKVSHIVNIRIPTKEDNSPRGFAYVEFANNTDFEKAFSLHHSMVNGRRINVQYSGANKKEGVAKNFKLQALQKAGKFAGGKNKPFQKKFGNKGK